MLRLPTLFKKQERPVRTSRSVEKKSIDSTLLAVVVGLSLFGALMVYSGSVLVAVKNDLSPYHYFIRQILWVILGLIALYITSRIDYRIIAKFAVPGLIVTIALLILVLFVNEGQTIKRWISLGPFDLQPSEIAKLTFLLYLSTRLAKQKEIKNIDQKAIVRHIKKDLLPFWGVLALVGGLIVMETDMDTTIMLALTSFIIYFVSGSDIIHTFGSIASGIIALLAGVILTVSKQYRLNRIETFFDFWKNGVISDPYSSGFQFRQILVAVASGGIFGAGFGESRQKYHYLGDTAFSDTIFAIFAEEFGLIGCIILVSIFMFILLKGIKIALRAPDRLGSLLALSITTWISLQAFLHIGANVGLIPINGNTLPFMSYGGSSTIINLTAIGILLNISKGGSGNYEEKEKVVNRNRWDLRSRGKRR